MAGLRLHYNTEAALSDICMDYMCVSEMEARMFKILRAYRANIDPVLGELRGKAISNL